MLLSAAKAGVAVVASLGMATDAPLLLAALSTAAPLAIALQILQDHRPQW